MKEYVISANDSGQRLDKYLSRLLKDAPSSFIYKMLRKKNITLNSKKASGNEHLSEGDTVKLFFSDETMDKFTGSAKEVPVVDFDPDIIYEDEHIMLVNKPVGILSQKAEADDVSMNEICLSYLTKKGEYDPAVPGAFTPSICNRLDRNTTGILIFAKSLIAARQLSQALKDRTLHKYYLTWVKGNICDEAHICGYLYKDEAKNKVMLVEDKEKGDFIETAYEPLEHIHDYTLLKVNLLTGKSHQIRAHLSSIGHPILGDNKYGDRDLNKSLGLKHQLLHAYRLEFADFDGELKYLSGKSFETEMPDRFKKISNLKNEV